MMRSEPLALTALIILVIGIATVVSISITDIAFSFSDENTILESAENSIRWEKGLILKWEDFQGTPSSEPSFAAVSLNYIGFDSVDVVVISMEPCVYQILSVPYYAGFDKNESWVRDESRINAELLNHEQRHFDIYGIYEKMMNDKISSDLLNKLIDCPEGDNLRLLIDDDSETRMDELTSDLLNELEFVNSLYEQETQHGAVPEIQRMWNEKIDLKLIELGIG